MGRPGHDLIHSTGWVKKKVILLKFKLASIISFVQFDRRWCKTKSNTLLKLKGIILAVQDLSETRQSQKQDNNNWYPLKKNGGVQLTTEHEAHDLFCRPMGINRNEIRG